MQDTITNNALENYSDNDQVMLMHTLKTKLQKYTSIIDKAFQFIHKGDDEQIFKVFIVNNIKKNIKIVIFKGL